MLSAHVAPTAPAPTTVIFIKNILVSEENNFSPSKVVVELMKSRRNNFFSCLHF
jgi:hypothetical protein